MINGLVRSRHRLVRTSEQLLQRNLSDRLPWNTQWHVLSMRVFGHILQAVIFLLEIPIHLAKTPMDSFTMMSRRGAHEEYLDSYTVHLQRMRASVATVVVLFALLGGELFLAVTGIIQFGKPSRVEAISTNVQINPSWDIDPYQNQKYIDDGGGGCVADITAYACNAAANTTLQWGTDDQVEQNASDCTVARFNKTYYEAMKYSLATVPSNATVTKVELIVNVSTARASTIGFRHINDAPDGLSCSTGALWSNIDTAANYTTVANWNTTGSKTIDLGSTAVTDVQSRIGGTYGLGIQAAGTSAFLAGAITSVDSASNKPVLKVTYTAPPETPTGMTHSAISTSTVTWGWTDTASVETRYDVHDAAHANVTGCTNLAADTSSCTETGLSANTQYTRHPNVTDAQGNTDGASASAYTAIEAVSGITFGTVTNTSIAVSSTNTPSNLASGSSGIYFQETVTSTNSGWGTTNSWTKSGLTANTQYSFQAKTKNGDAVETSLSSATTKYTLTPAASITPGRSTSTWYTTPGFTFTNAAGWGAGGVQYYRYAWDQSATHSFTGSESTWSTLNANCPGGTCTTANATLTATATADGNAWYLHVLPYNASDVANGTGTNDGPYYYDGTAPAVITSVTDDGATTSSTTSLHATWTSTTDPASGLLKYQYAIGTTAGGIETVAWTDNGTTASITQTGLTLANGSTYYISVRAIDVANNISAATASDGILVDAAGPIISSFAASVTTTTATLTWTTSEPATTQVSYGTTTSYGGSSALDSTLATAHSVTLSKLVEATTYHAQALSVDAIGNSTASSDLAFTTSSTPVATPEINPDPTPAPTATLAAPTFNKPILPTKSSSPIRFTGKAKGGQTVSVYLDDKLFKKITLKGKSTLSVAFYIDVNTTKLKSGNHRIYAKVKNAADQFSNKSKTITFTVTKGKVTKVKLASLYTVQSGDSLWKISERFLGGGAAYGRLVSTNAIAHVSLTANPSLIQPGWQLTVPPG